MKTSWIIFILFLFGVFTYLYGIAEMTVLGADKAAVIQGLMQPDIPEYNVPLGSLFAFINIGWSYIQLFFTVMWFLPALFQGTFGMVNFMLIFPILAAIVFTMIIILRGVPNR